MKKYVKIIVIVFLMCVNGNYLYENVYAAPNLVGGSSEIGLFETAQMDAGVSIVNITLPSNGKTVKAIKLNKGANHPVISLNSLNLKMNTSYVLEFDYWAPTEGVTFNVDLWPSPLPKYYLIANRFVKHFKQEINSPLVEIQNSHLRILNDMDTWNPCDIYITNVQMYEKVYSTKNLAGGNSEIGLFETAQMDTGITIVDITNPASGKALKAIKLNKGANHPVISLNSLKLKMNTSYILEFDYWAPTESVTFNVDLWPDPLPKYNVTANSSVKHFKREISSSVVEMQNCHLRFFNDMYTNNPCDIFITNVQIYEKIYNTKNLVGSNTEIGIFETVQTDTGITIVDIANPASGKTVKAIKLNKGTEHPVISLNSLDLKMNTSYLLEFDYWAPTDSVVFNVDLWPEPLPKYNVIANRSVKHFKQEINSSIVEVQNSHLRFLNNMVTINPCDIYITNIQIYEKIYSTSNLTGGNTEIGLFETAQMGNGIAIDDLTNPASWKTLKAIKLNKGADHPVISLNSLDLRKNISYILEFDYWAPIESVTFNVDLWPDPKTKFNVIANRSIKHFKQEINSSISDINNFHLRFLNDMYSINPCDIYITNILFYEKEYAISYEYDATGKRLLNININGKREIEFIYDSNGNLIGKTGTIN